MNQPGTGVVRNRREKSYSEVYGTTKENKIALQEEDDEEIEELKEKLKGLKNEIPNIKSTYQYLKLTIRESRRNKVTYCLGCLACFIVVFVVALMVTILSHTPVVFLRLSELQEGEIDVIISSHEDMGYDFINYTLCSELLSGFEEFTYSSPRYQLNDGDIEFFASKSCDDITLYTNFTNWAYEGITGITFENCSTVGNCFDLLCENSYSSPVYLIDSVKENIIGIGRDFPINTPIPQNQLYLSTNLANQLGISENSTVYLKFQMKKIFSGLWSETVNEYLNSDEGELYTTEDANLWSIVFVPFTVNWTFSETYGKADSTIDNLAFIEYSLFISSISDYLNPSLPIELQEKIKTWNLYDYSDIILINYPPDSRMDVYTTNDIDSINRLFVDFSSNIAYILGFSQITISMPVLEGLNNIQVYSLFMGLILNIITFILLFLSIILIYSLLMVSVETRTFEMGILRMVGMSRNGVIQLLLLQAFTYSAPAWSAGLLVAQISAFFVGLYFEHITGVQIENNLTLKAITWSTLIGSIVPIASSIFPISNALGVNLHDAIDVQHSKSKAIEVNIERSEDSGFSWSLFAVGLFLAGFGFAIYYVIPLALLSEQLTLLLNMFFALLIMMLLGLVLLSLNAQRILEKLIVNTVFWWDKAAVRAVILKNMIAHRKRNRKTTIMYALSLGFIIFIYVSYDIQMNTIVYAEEWSKGTTITVYTNSIYGLNIIEPLEDFVRNNSIISSYAWSTQALDYGVGFYSSVKLTNIGHTFYDYNSLYAITPRFFDTVQQGFLNVDQSDSSSPYSLIEQLYTPLGTGSAFIGTLYKKDLALPHLDDQFLIEADYTRKNLTGINYFRLKVGATLNSSPVFRLSQYPTSPDQDILTSFPTYVMLCKDWINSIEDIPIRTLYIQLNSTAEGKDYDNLKKELKDVVKNSNAIIFDYRSSLEIIDEVNLAMRFFFGFTVVMAMSISFFSLVSSMYSNVLEQSKEIGVLRAIGLPYGWMQRIYVSEAFTLVFSSSMMGMIIGIVVGWTVAIQQVMFTQFPVNFQFPYELFLVIFAMSVIFSIFASYGPITSLMNQSIVSIFRKL